MENTFSRLKGLIPRAGQSLEQAVEDTQSYTPKNFVSGYIKLPRNAKPLEAAWHAAAIALETESLRLIHCEADGGIYFIAAAAADFASYPNTTTPLACALPNNAGHVGDGAYLVEIRGGIVAAVIKGECSLHSYVGMRDEVMRFIGNTKLNWPIHSSPWIGYSEFEGRHARKLASYSVFAGMALTGIFIAAAMLLTVASEYMAHRKDAVLAKIAEKQNIAATQLNSNSASQSPYTTYRDIASAVMQLDGKLINFSANQREVHFEAEVPLWVTDLSALGEDIKTRLDKNHIVVTR